MQKGYRIPELFVEQYAEDICFLVDCDNIHIQVVIPRTAWAKPLGYEVKIDDTKDIIEALLNELVDPKETYFDTCEEAKTRISLEIDIPQVLKRGKKKLKPSRRNQKRKMTLLCSVREKEKMRKKNLLRRRGK